MHAYLTVTVAFIFDPDEEFTSNDTLASISTDYMTDLREAFTKYVVMQYNAIRLSYLYFYWYMIEIFTVGMPLNQKILHQKLRVSKKLCGIR
jgi:hypothetical protein